MRVCSRCVMDTTDPDITFDANGICSHCHEYDRYVGQAVLKGEAAEARVQALVQEMKAAGANKPYDCVIGVSGGVDSTYVAYRLKQLGLRILAVHFDNGWNSELAVKNIENVVKRLQIDLHTWVVDWEEFKALQLAYLRAGVPNLEAPSDHGIWSSIYSTTAKHGIKYIISGHNAVTEGHLPWAWGYHPRDARQMKALYRRFSGRRSFKTFPSTSIPRFIYYIRVLGLRRIPILNYLDYSKEDAVSTITRELDWRDYGWKHYESIYTRFFQGYILPMRFGYDKRKSHLSTLVCSGQITRDEALQQLTHNPYLENGQADEDKDYVIKKLGLTPQEFERLMSLQRHTHRDYPSNRWFFENLPQITETLRRFQVRYN